jgi:hypothetical protein
MDADDLASPDLTDCLSQLAEGNLAARDRILELCSARLRLLPPCVAGTTPTMSFKMLRYDSTGLWQKCLSPRRGLSWLWRRRSSIGS